MGFFSFLDRFRGERVDGELIFIVADTAFASAMPRPTGAVAEAEQDPCEKCGRRLEERILATALPADESATWDEAPVAVDGWVRGQAT